MKNLAANGQSGNVQLGNGFVIHYPGYKGNGDYKLTVNGQPPKHTDIVNTIVKLGRQVTLAQMTSFLDDVYANGLNATQVITGLSKELLYWITLQEEINYPPPKSGRKMPFQRFFEAALVVHHPSPTITNAQVIARTNNHGGTRPVLWKLPNGVASPVFYV